MAHATTTSIETNLEIVRKNISEFVKGNISFLIDSCAEDINWSTYKIPGVPFTDTFKGKAELQKYFLLLMEDITFSSFDAKEFIGQGNTVMVLGHSSGIIKRTNKTFDHDWCMHIEIRDGKTNRYFLYVDSFDIYNAYQQ